MLKFVNNVVDTVKDFGRQACIAVDPHRRKPDAQFTRYGDGSLEHNVDLSDFPAEKRQVAEQVVHRSIEEIEQAEARLADARASGDTEAEELWEGRLARRKETFTEVKWQLETRDIDLSTISAGLQFGPGVFVTESLRTGKLDRRLKDAAELQSATGATGTTDTSGTAATEGADPDGPSALYQELMSDMDATVEQFETDPKEFFDKLRKLGSQERAEVMMALQTHIQANNRLMSMLTNFQQAMHDTNKAVISNLRV